MSLKGIKAPRQAVFRSDNLDTKVGIKTTLQWIWEDIGKYVNSNPFSSSRLVTVADSGAATTDFAVQHGLGRLPNGYVITSLSKAAIVYNGSTPSTTENLYLQATDANVALDVLVF